MEESQTISPSLYSQHLKTTGNSYFFDVKAAKNGHKYLRITESRIKDGQKYRNSITVFSDKLPEFQQLFSEMSEKTK